MQCHTGEGKRKYLDFGDTPPQRGLQLIVLRDWGRGGGSMGPEVFRDFEVEGSNDSDRKKKNDI